FLAPWSGRVVTLAVVLAFAALAARFMRRRAMGGHSCPRCDYDLSATPIAAPCPECGQVSSTRGLSRRRPALALVALALALALPGYVAQRRMRQCGADYYLRLHPLYLVFREQTLDSAALPGGYRVQVARDRRSVAGMRVVLRGPSGPPFELSETRAAFFAKPGEARDLNGDGVPDLHISTHSGGAHCCTADYFVSLDPTGPRVLAAFKPGERAVAARDIDGD